MGSEQEQGARKTEQLLSQVNSLCDTNLLLSQALRAAESALDKACDGLREGMSGQAFVAMLAQDERRREQLAAMEAVAGELYATLFGAGPPVPRNPLETLVRVAERAKALYYSRAAFCQKCSLIELIREALLHYGHECVAWSCTTWLEPRREGRPQPARSVTQKIQQEIARCQNLGPGVAPRPGD